MKTFQQIAIGAEFWQDGTFWFKTSDTTAESWSTIRTFAPDAVVTAH